MTQPAHRKFDFGAVFDDDGAVVSPGQSYRRMYSPEEVERIRQQALAEGERVARAGIEAASAQALGEIARATQAALSTLAAAVHEHRSDAAALALAAAGRIADAALELFPHAPAKAALESLAREIEAAPRLIVRVAPGLVESLQAELNATADQVGYAGRIEVKAESGAPDAAFVFDWGDGRATYDPKLAAERVSDALDAALAAEGLHGEPINLTFDFGRS